MNGELAALIAVELHGNEWLSDTTRPVPSLERDNSTFKYVHQLTFVEPKRGPLRRERRVAGTAEWLLAQRHNGVERLALYSPASGGPDLPPHIATSFANGVPRGFVTEGKDRCLWSSAWEVSEEPRSETRPWNVTMTSGISLPPPSLVVATSIPAAGAELAASLEVVRSFAMENDLTDWGDWFSKAIDAAYTPDPVVPYNPDIAPGGALSLERQQLIASAAQAWVFGGMGSWNDVWLEDEALAEELVRVTKRLYGAVLEALVAATNGS